MVKKKISNVSQMGPNIFCAAISQNYFSEHNFAAPFLLILPTSPISSTKHKNLINIFASSIDFQKGNGLEKDQ